MSKAKEVQDFMLNLFMKGEVLNFFSFFFFFFFAKKRRKVAFLKIKIKIKIESQGCCAKVKATPSKWCHFCFGTCIWLFKV